MYWSVLPQPSVEKREEATRNLAESIAVEKHVHPSEVFDLSSLFVHGHNHDHDAEHK